jgi:hypothetical protein
MYICRPEAVADLVYLLNTLLDKDGSILVTGLHDDVAELSPKEAALYDEIEFDVEEYKASVGSQQLLHKEDKVCYCVHETVSISTGLLNEYKATVKYELNRRGKMYCSSVTSVNRTGNIYFYISLTACHIKNVSVRICVS